MGVADKENIFLMEIIVDRLDIDSDYDSGYNFLEGNTFIEFRFLKHGPLCISDNSEEDMSRALTTVKNGNSCLFSMTSPNIKKACSNFDLLVDVFKKCNDCKFTIARINHPLTVLFCRLIQDADLKGVPCAKTTKEEFDLVDDSGEARGNLSVFIRMSCFGRMIINKFQLDIVSKAVSFQNSKMIQNKPKNDKGYCCCCNKPIKPSNNNSVSNKCYIPSSGNYKKYCEKTKSPISIKVVIEDTDSSENEEPCPCCPCVKESLSYCCPCDEESLTTDGQGERVGCFEKDGRFGQDGRVEQVERIGQDERVGQGGRLTQSGRVGRFEDESEEKPKKKKMKLKTKKTNGTVGKKGASREGSYAKSSSRLNGGCVYFERTPPSPPCYTGCYNPCNTNCLPQVPCMCYPWSCCSSKSCYDSYSNWC